MSTSSSDLSRIVLTGASGWVGKAILHQLQAYLTPAQFLERVIPFSSSQKKLQSTGYPGKPYFFYTHPLAEACRIIPSSKTFTLIHSAFLTKDRISDYGEEKFLSINQKITQQALSIAKKKNIEKIVLISSGAAAKYEDIIPSQSSMDGISDIYAFLKRSEEIYFHDLSRKCNVFRIFALSGPFSRSPHSFAMLSFLNSAMKGERIYIKSNKKVIRGYLSSSQLALAVLNIIRNNYDLPNIIDAITDDTDLLTMATFISKLFELDKPVAYINPALEGDIYTADSTLFRALLEQYSICPMSIKEQLCETIDWLKK